MPNPTTATTETDASALFRAVDLDARALRNAFGAIPSAVAVLGAAHRESPLSEGTGMTVATLLPVSLDPPCLGVMMQLDSLTWPALADFDEIGVSVLADHQGWVGRRVATGAREERFAGVPTHRGTDASAIFVNGAAAHFAVTVAEQTPAGDHLFALLRVHAMRVNDAREPSIFHRSLFRSLREGVAEPGAWMWQLGDVWQ